MKVFKTAAAQEPLEFQIDEDTFTAIAPNRLPGNVLINYVEEVSDGKVYVGHKHFFEKALVKDSAEKFAERLDSTENPINLQQMIEVAEWLVNEYSAFTVGGEDK
jgi:hypothetical protein